MVEWNKKDGPLSCPAVLWIVNVCEGNPDRKKNIENLIEIGLGAGDIIADNHSANVNALSALKKYSIQNEVVV